MTMQLAKGVRDFPPEEKIPRQELVAKLQEVFETYGFVPLETPALERMETLLAKGGAGTDSDALKEVFTLKDQGGRDLGLRFDLTVPLARFVAMDSSIRMPFKRYEIGRVYRDGPIKTGRYREFWQCDIDTIGCKGMIAEAEQLMIAQKAFTDLGIEVDIFVNNRKVLTGLLKAAGIAEERMEDAIITIDKLAKIGPDGVREELLGKGFSDEQINKALEYTYAEGTNEEKLSTLEKRIPLNEGLLELAELLSLVPQDSLVLSPSLARGLAYYTGTVWEAFSKDATLNFSLAGGGRYDDMIGNFSGKGDVPAVGMSFGLEPILETLRKQGKLKESKSLARAYVVPVGKLNEAFMITNRLREAGLRIDIDLLGRGPGKNFAYIDKAGIPFAIIIGEKEISEDKVTLKDMSSGNEELLSFDETIARLK